VGAAFARVAAKTGEVVLADRGRCDLANEDQVRAFVAAIRPDVIVNAAAYTAVDLAESQRDLCFAINATAPGAMAQEAAKMGALLIHYSTDYVFDGTKQGEYFESDVTGPLGVYGASKLAGEQAILASGARALILRTSWVYGLHGKNFLQTILRLAAERSELRIVADQVGSPTSANAIANATVDLIALHRAKANLPVGIYHMTAAGSTSWHGFAEAIVAGLNNPPRVMPIATDDYPTPAKRPANSVLSNDKFHTTFGFRLAPWRQQLQEVLAQGAETAK
jgi:dTDP-4-dehydrorhamnose reductase